MLQIHLHSGSYIAMYSVEVSLLASSMTSRLSSSSDNVHGAIIVSMIPHLVIIMNILIDVDIDWNSCLRGCVDSAYFLVQTTPTNLTSVTCWAAVLALHMCRILPVRVTERVSV